MFRGAFGNMFLGERVELQGSFSRQESNVG